MAAETITITWLLEKAWVLISAAWIYDKKRMDKILAQRAEEAARQQEVINQLLIWKANVLSEQEVKSLIKEFLSPLKEDQKEIKTLLQGMNENIQLLTKDMAVQNAIRRVNHEQHQQNTPSG